MRRSGYLQEGCPQVLERREVATLLSHLSHHLEWREALLQDLKRFVAQVSLRDAEAQPDSEDEIRFVPFPPTTPVPAAEVDSSNLVGRKAHGKTRQQIKEHCEEEPQQNTGASSSNSDPPTTQNEKKLIGEGYLQVGRADLEQTNGSHHHHGETTQNSEFPPPFQSRLSTTVPRQEKKDNEPREPDQNKTEERRSQTDSHDLAGAQPSAVKSRMEVPNPLPHQHAIESSGAFQSGTAAGPFLRPASVPKVCTESKGLVVRESLEEHSPSSMLSHTPWKLHLVPPLVGKNLEPDPSDMREAFHLQRGGNHELGTQPLSIFRVQQNESSRIKTENRRRTDERNAEGWNDKNTQKAIIHPEKTVAASQGTHKSFFNDLSHGAFPPSRQAIQCVAQPASNNSSPSSFPPPEFFKRQVAATCATPNRPLPEAKCTERDSLQVPLRVTTTNPRLHTEDPPHPLQPSPSASSLEQTPGEKSSAMHRGETENGIMEEMTGAWNLRSQKGLHRKPAEPSSKDGAPGDNPYMHEHLLVDMFCTKQQDEQRSFVRAYASSSSGWNDSERVGFACVSSASRDAANLPVEGGQTKARKQTAEGRQKEREAKRERERERKKR
uniref:Uncharacterized protein n=1 Tax=Chromera velia CCMP2878 TaxID=1169474 RepID=A0A0G4H3X6_9ALVE|eukprot:Cvel_24598.t1-p1 / transcript=Cvel_24598.t1 / gene=Cvel_24598 / organism=Chromera_velia_CCMP2878 / gene_product=hypothetical protein / transcript_product=hypothetical protein / location=Cvel_scaffold2679:11799-18733(-) / protein_length=607 / sequence_SO=supercontig / SO=protein_coding / is_pseudo=false